MSRARTRSFRKFEQGPDNNLVFKLRITADTVEKIIRELRFIVDDLEKEKEETVTLSTFPANTGTDITQEI